MDNGQGGSWIRARRRQGGGTIPITVTRAVDPPIVPRLSVTFDMSAGPIHVTLPPWLWDLRHPHSLVQVAEYSVKFQRNKEMKRWDGQVRNNKPQERKEHDYATYSAKADKGCHDLQNRKLNRAAMTS